MGNTTSGTVDDETTNTLHVLEYQLSLRDSCIKKTKEGNFKN